MKTVLKFLVLAGLVWGAAAGAAPVARISITADAPLALPRALEVAVRSGVKKIIIAPGTYTVDTLLAFRNLTNVTIEATGVTLLRALPAVPGLEFARCRNVALRGLTLQCATPPFTQGRVENIDDAGRWLELRVDAGYPTNYFEGEDHRLFLRSRDAAVEPGTFDSASARGEPRRRAVPAVWRARPRAARLRAGDLIAFRGPGAADIFVNGCSAMEISER